MCKPLSRIFPLLLIAPGLAHTQAPEFETPPIVSAADILPASVLQSEHHRVEDDVRSDGYLNYFTIRSDYGTFEAASMLMLRIRVHEIEALAQLDEVSKSEVFIEAAADAGINQIRTVAEFATHPVETVKGIPDGIGRLFRRTKRQAGDGYDAARERITDDDEEDVDGDDDGITTEEVKGTAESGAKWYFGVSGAERRWHKELGTNPYTSNEVLREAVESVAWADRLGRFGVKVAGMPTIPGVGIIGSVNDVVWDADPYELEDLNRSRLSEADVDEELIERFFDHPVFNPAQQTYLIAAIAELDGVAGRGGIVGQSLIVDTEPEVVFFVESVMMLAWYHRNESPFTRIETQLTLPFGVRADGGTTATLAVDRVYWVDTVAEITGRAVALRDETVDPTHELWLAGTASDIARRKLTDSGWDIRENFTIMAEPDPIDP